MKSPTPSPYTSIPEQHAAAKAEPDPVEAVPYPDRIRLKARRDTLTHEIAELRGMNKCLRSYLDHVISPWLAENDAAIGYRQPALDDTTFEMNQYG